MICRPIFSILTFVLCAGLFSVAAHGAASTEQENIVESRAQDTDSVDSKTMQDISIAPPPEKTQVRQDRKLEVFYPYQNSISPRLGLGFDTKGIGSYTFFHIFGLNYMLDSLTNKHIEIGVDLVNDGTGMLSAGQKIIFNQNGEVRPYVKFGLGVKLNPTEQLNTLLKIDNYQLRAAVGFEKLFAFPLSGRFDFDTFFETNRIGFIFVLGYSWGW